jgi:HlyD family secretion protein
MNKQTRIVLIIVVLLVVVVVLYFLFSPGGWNQMAGELEVGAGSRATGLVASGFIEAEEVDVAAEIGGRVVGLPVEEGDEVVEGDVIVQIDPTILEAQRDAAQAQLDMVTAQLALLQAGTREEIIAQAEAQVAAAEAGRDAAYAAWQDALAIRNNPQDIELQVAQAFTQVQVAQEQMDAAEIQLQSAERAQQLYYDAIENIENYYHAPISEYESWMGPRIGTGLGMTLAPNHYWQAWAGFDSAQAALDGANNMLGELESLQGNPLALEAEVINAEAAYHAAEASLAEAQAQLERLELGATEEEIAMAEAQVQEAQAALDAIQTQLDKLTLTAPTGGLVLESAIHEGELAAPGTPLITIADLDAVELTVYVPEDQFNQVYLGQTVQVRVDSFPGRTFEGEVVRISDEAEFTPRSVQTREERVNLVYAVKISIANPDHALKPGMPADAYFAP